MLYEIAQGETTAAALAQSLGLDPAFLSRLLRRLVSRGLVARTPSATDRREAILALTAEGHAEFEMLDRRSQQDTAAQLGPLTETQQCRLVAAMRAIEGLLGDPVAPRGGVVIRPFRGGDLGWMLARHARFYAEEYGFDRAFERLVAQIVADFLARFDPEREACWIAEIDGEPVGSIMLVDAGDRVAKLRLLLVEPRARGHGIGRRLVEECVRFARAGRLPQDHAVDPEHPHRGARDLSALRFHEGRREAAPGLRRRSRRRDLGDRFVGRCSSA